MTPPSIKFIISYINEYNTLTKKCVLQKECVFSYNEVVEDISTHTKEDLKMLHCKKVHVSNESRMELHDALSLTGAEISINTLPAGGCVPFIHRHKNNEEIYGIIAGSGKVIIDDEETPLVAGDWIKITPLQKRQFFAGENDSMTFVCIQVKENSLDTYTMTDAEIIQ